jgi:hypothetical protein
MHIGYRRSMAFTQTTVDGKQFASAYCGTDAFKIYDLPSDDLM